jgi:hypothetical protein
VVTRRPFPVVLPSMSHAIAPPDDHPVTAAEFERFPEAQQDDKRWEPVDGRIHM